VSTATPSGKLPALAFEVALIPSEADLTLVVYGARGAHLLEPATALSVRAMATLLGDWGKREGARFVLKDLAGRLARTLLPEAGVRAPGSDHVHLTCCGESDGTLFAAFQKGATTPAHLPLEATLAAEAARLTREADDARLEGDLERARHLDVAALSRAPRHPEIARRIAEIDHCVGGRADAANTLLSECGASLVLGLLGGELLADAGDVPGAIAALLRAAERDPSHVVAALAYARAAELAHDPADALLWLDAGIARAPLLFELRWERAHRRIMAGRIADGRADIQELEALACGARDRHDVLRRAGDLYRAVGLGSDAADLYERALRYRPEDPTTLAGLGAALAGEGRAARGAAILAQAVEAASLRNLPTTWMLLELGRVLGERLADRPAAVARLRDIPDEAPEGVAARGLEGRFRAELGDVSGAALAFARMRERAGREPSALPWLDEAARFEQERGDLQAAQRYLAAALAITPSDTALSARYRAIGEQIAPPKAFAAPVAIAPEPVAPVAHVAPTPLPVRTDSSIVEIAPSEASRASFDIFGDDSPDAALGQAEDEARIEALTRTLQGDPSNDAVVDELVVLLSRLGRSMDLLALLSARLEDAPAERRMALLPKHREVLGTLETEARREGRDAEADLFKMAREMSNEP
jgi:tetratricopeptide (TPR) repeat protein